MAGPPELPPDLPPDPARRGSRVLLVVLVVIGALVLVGSVLVGWAIDVGWIPDTKCLPGARLSDHARSFLDGKGITARDETVLYFYSAGMWSYAEDGNLFTDRRVVSYWKDVETGQRIVMEATYPEITDIRFIPDEDRLADSTILVTLRTGTEFNLVVSNEDGGDREFHRLLVQTWGEKR